MAETRLRTLIPTEFRAESLSGAGKVRNVSARGLFVGTRAIPEEGETVELELAEPGWPRISLTGLVWWTAREPGDRNARCGFGLRIVDDNDAYLRLVASLR